MKPKPFILTGLVVLLISSGSFALAIPTIDVLSQEYTAKAAMSPGCFVTNSSPNPPVSASCSNTTVPPFGFATATASGSVGPNGGFLNAFVGVIGFPGLAEARAMMDFQVTEPLLFTMETSGNFIPQVAKLVLLRNVTDDVVYQTPIGGSYGFFLETSKHYRLEAWAQAIFDPGFARVNFGIPEPPSFWLLLPALGLLGVGQRLRANRRVS